MHDLMRTDDATLVSGINQRWRTAAMRCHINMQWMSVHGDSTRLGQMSRLTNVDIHYHQRKVIHGVIDQDVAQKMRAKDGLMLRCC